MKTIAALSVLCLTLAGCSEKPRTAPPPSRAALPDRLQSRFEDYCDETGSLGIGFVAWHTYDFRFRQYLKQTQDPELKRLYVLAKLHYDTDRALYDLEKGIRWTGKTSSRQLTAEEWQAARQRISEEIDELAKYTAFTNYAAPTRGIFDHPDPHLMFWIDDLRQTLQKITNAPGANQNAAPNAAPPHR